MDLSRGVKMRWERDKARARERRVRLRVSRGIAGGRCGGTFSPKVKREKRGEREREPRGNSASDLSVGPVLVEFINMRVGEVVNVLSLLFKRFRVLDLGCAKVSTCIPEA